MTPAEATDYETLLLKEQSNPNAAILRFFLSNYEAEDIVVIVEGKDDPPFYFDFLKSYFPDQSFCYFPCGGKPILMELKQFLTQYGIRPAPKKVLFLADKDFDDYLHLDSAGIFKTDYYSIENYFCSEHFLEYMMRKYGAGQIKNSAIPVVAKRFKDIIEQGSRELLVPMAAICALREQKIDLDLDAISCADLLNINSATSNFSKNAKRAEAFIRIGVVDRSIKFSLVRKYARKFQPHEFNRWLRGKYALQLMRLALRILCDEFATLRDFLRKLGGSFSTEAFRFGKPFLNEIPNLREYCVQQP